MTDRQPTKPRRVLFTPEDNSVISAAFYGTIDMADEPYDGYEGTEWNKENVLTDETAAGMGLAAEDDPSPNDAFAALLDGNSPSRLIANRIYSGVDLQEKFSTEIYNSYPTPWDWMADRIDMAFYNGLNVGDYIPFTAAGNTILAEIAGIDTYYNYGDTAISHHIDFISRDCWPDTHVYNKVNYNNGTSMSPSPWLASDLYAYLNSLQMNVPNAATANPALVAVDYRAAGVYDKLPAALQAVIATKRLLLPSRYTAGSLLTNDNSGAWADAGKLWVPSEVEVYGMEQWGSKNGYSSFGFQQYPIFATNMKRVKGAGDGGARSHWWLLSASGGQSANCALVSDAGGAGSNSASYSTIRVPVCFRIA